jgi:uncharacterized phiE125 gp8 family phage protein
MYRPVLISPAALPPVSLAEAKLHMRVDHNDDDALIAGLIGGATQYLDGWTGVLGACLVEQTWRQDFDCFDRNLYLPLGPVIDVSSITWRDTAGVESAVSTAVYDLVTDETARTFVRFVGDFVFPSDLHESRAVAVAYRAGYETTQEIPAADPGPTIPARITVPEPLRVAILLMAAHWYSNREAVAQDALAELPIGVDSLIAPYRRVGV